MSPERSRGPEHLSYVQVFGPFDVTLVAGDVVITRYWRTSRRIPVDRIIAVTNLDASAVASS
jgi:hypothetical protein